MQKRILFYAIACLLSLNVFSQYIYEANQSLIDLTNQSGTTSLNSQDDQVSAAFNLGFTFDFYGSGFTQARMATNGCLHFKTSGAYCSDYTPDPLTSQYTYTLLPFWTDLIRDNNSKMLAKSFNDKTVFGWYDMREFNRASDNSFEVILWTNDNFEFRYGALDIINHDVLVGEVGSGSSEVYQYLYHDKCNTGTTNTSDCVNTTWNDSSSNTLLESGGSLYGVGSGNALDCSNALNNVNCAGYAAAYLTQQCDLDSLYSDECTGYADAYLTQQCDITQLYDTTCPSYWNAYDAQQCEDDAQYSPSCPGYQQNESVAYYVEEDDYGYTEEDLWYDEEYDEYLDPNDPCYENRCEGFTDADWYELDVEQFGQEQVDDWMGSDISFSDDGMIEFDTTLITSYDDIDVMMDVYDTEQEEIRVAENLALEEEQQRYEEEILQEELFLLEEEIYAVELHSTQEEHIDYLEEFVVIDEYTNNQREVIDILDAEELIELYEFDTIIREELELQEEIFAIREEVRELEEEIEELREEEKLFELEEEIENRIAETEHKEKSEQVKERSSVRISALDVVAGTLRSAKKSVTESKVETSTTVASVSNNISVENSSNNSFIFENISSTSVSDSVGSFNTGSSVSFNGVVNYGSITSSSTSNASSSSFASSSSSSGGGISTSSSPSRSDQFASASMQTNQVLDMSSMSILDTSSSNTLDNTTSVGNTTSIGDTTSVGDTTNVSVSVVSVDTVSSTTQSQIDTSINAMDTSSDTEAVVENLIAQNLQTAQEEVEAQQEETGEYGSENTIIAYMGFVPGFNNYTQISLVDQDQWYASKEIYTTTMPDNLNAFYGLASSNISKMNDIIELQPKL
tara:strand:- start:167 stop:2737 length:2571 start_codon:yes stop_codon:yes gene_type:complete